MTTRPLAQARAPRGGARRRAPSRLCAQAKGAGMISPAFATMLCFVETDARDRRRRRSSGCCARRLERSFERITVDGQLSTNDSVFMLASGAVGRGGRARQRTTSAAFGDRARRAAAPARDRDRRRRRGRRRASRGWSCAAPPSAVEPVARAVGRLAAGEVRAARRRPELGPDAAAAGQALPDAATRAIDLCDRGTCRSRAAGAAVDARRRRAARGSRRRCARRRGRHAARAVRRRRRRRELFFCDLGHEYVSLQLGVLDVSDARLGHPQIATLLESLPYIREFFGATIVIKYGGAAMAEEDAARGVRDRRRAAQVRRA